MPGLPKLARCQGSRLGSEPGDVASRAVFQSAKVSNKSLQRSVLASTIFPFQLDLTATRREAARAGGEEDTPAPPPPAGPGCGKLLREALQFARLCRHLDSPSPMDRCVLDDSAPMFSLREVTCWGQHHVCDRENGCAAGRSDAYGRAGFCRLPDVAVSPTSASTGRLSPTGPMRAEGGCAVQPQARRALRVKRLQYAPRLRAGHIISGGRRALLVHSGSRHWPRPARDTARLQPSRACLAAAGRGH